MHDHIPPVLDTLDAALAEAAEVAEPKSVDDVARVANRLRNRLDYPDDLILVALAGGTGSGKSSLFNALTSSDTADVGGVRPTTSVPMVSLPDSKPHVFGDYLESFSPLETTTHPDLDWLALIDLPDTDSVIVDHRFAVERILPRVDMVVWVVDVEKYRDDALHRGFLRDLVPFEDQLLFVMNQVDRLPAAEQSPLLEDLKRALLEDGFVDPLVLGTAARPTIGPTSGVPQLLDALRAKAGGSVVAKLLVDLERVVSEMTGAIGASGIDFESRRGELCRDVARLAVQGDAVQASRRVAGFFAALADELVGKPSEAALEVSAHVGEELRGILRTAEAEVPIDLISKRGFLSSNVQDRNIDARTDFVERRLLSYVDEMMKPVLRSRAVAISRLAELATAAGGLRSAHER